MHDQINARANTILWVLFAASALLFVIACLNVANLVLARTVRRESELAVRSALGANTVALRRLLLTESLVLCGSGVLGAFLLAWPMVAALGRYAARYSVRADGLSLDSTLVWFGIVLALLASVFLAYVPRLPSERAELSSSLNSGGTRGSTGSSNNRLRIFAVMQIAASFVLLTGAATLMRTLYTLESTPPPFDPSRVLAINLPVLTYGKTPQQVQEFYREVPRRVSTLPGVTHASTGFSVPWRDAQELGIAFMFTAPGAAVSKNGLEDWRAKFRSISPGYFGTLGVPLIAGRDFRDSDKEGSGRVVIVSQKLAQTLFPGQSALNHELRWTDGVMKFIGISMEPRRIVGVVPDFDDENIIPSPEMMVYEPADQEGWNGRLLVNVSGGDPYSLAPAIRRTIHDISAEQPVERISTLKDIRAEVMVPDKLNAVVFGGFALVALLISVVGVAGVLAFSVSSRTREFGIRMALGAKPRDILQDVLRQGVRMATIGVIAGVILGIVFARGLGRYISEVQLPGTPAFLISGFVILAAAVIASAVPAARAARVNAMEALRAE
jgi:predicted permease